MITDSDGPLLLCYDGSENAQYAIERAGALLGGRQAVVVTVWRPTADLGSMGWSDMPATMGDFVELDRAAAEGGGRLAEAGVRIAHEAGLEAYAVAVKAAGPVWKTILEIAERHDVAASHGVTRTRGHPLDPVGERLQRRRPSLRTAYAGHPHSNQ